MSDDKGQMSGFSGFLLFSALYYKSSTAKAHSGSGELISQGTVHTALPGHENRRWHLWASCIWTLRDPWSHLQDACWAYLKASAAVWNPAFKGFILQQTSQPPTPNCSAKLWFVPVLRQPPARSKAVALPPASLNRKEQDLKELCWNGRKMLAISFLLTSRQCQAKNLTEKAITLFKVYLGISYYSTEFIMPHNIVNLAMKWVRQAWAVEPFGFNNTLPYLLSPDFSTNCARIYCLLTVSELLQGNTILGWMQRRNDVFHMARVSPQ